MILSDIDIKKALNSGRIVISPFPDFTSQLGHCSIDFRLGNKFQVFKHSQVPFIDPNNPKYSDDIMDEVTVKDSQAFILQPGDFVLAVTKESFSLPADLLGRLEGRSSLGRLGIVVHSTASTFQPGWNGVVVMELGNLARIPVALYPGMRVCAISFEQLTSPAEIPYNKKKGAKYINQISPLPSKISSDKN